MVIMTMIARVADGLPLTASVQEDEQCTSGRWILLSLHSLQSYNHPRAIFMKSGRTILEYQNQAKMLFRKLTPSSPSRCTIQTGPYLFHYLIEHDVCYLVLCEKNYSKRLAFSYLENLAQEFRSQYGKQIYSVSRPYGFIEFDIYIQKTKKSFMDSRTRRNLNSLNTELQDVQRIMVQNIDDVLQRGAVLSELDTKAQNLSMLSQQYKKDASILNSKSMMVKGVAVGVILMVFIMYFWIL